MTITLEIVAHADQPQDISSVLGQDPYHGAARDNPLWHYRSIAMAAQEGTWLKQLMRIFINRRIIK